jgi:hypothetical protein
MSKSPLEKNKTHNPKAGNFQPPQAKVMGTSDEANILLNNNIIRNQHFPWQGNLRVGGAEKSASRPKS